MVLHISKGKREYEGPKSFSWIGVITSLIILPFQVAIVHFSTILSIFGFSSPFFLLRDFIIWYRTVFKRRLPLMFVFRFYNPRHFIRTSKSLPIVARPLALLDALPLLRPPQRADLPRKLLILDVDESLLLASRRPLPFCTYALPLPPRHSDDDVVHHYFVCERPHVQFFLSLVSTWYTVVVFTAGTRGYVTPMIQRLDPGGKYISATFCRDSLDGSLKRLTVPVEAMRPSMPHLSLAHVVHVDDRPAVMESADNSVVLPPFTAAAAAEGTDDALLHALPLLDALRHVSDVRHVLSLRPRRSREAFDGAKAPPSDTSPRH